jgi:hypothetical protein
MYGLQMVYHALVLKGCKATMRAIRVWEQYYSHPGKVPNVSENMGLKTRQQVLERTDHLQYGPHRKRCIYNSWLPR